MVRVPSEEGGSTLRDKSSLKSTTRIAQPFEFPARQSPFAGVGASPTLPAEFEPLTLPPRMGRRNGCGTILLGWMRDAELPGFIVKVLWLTILFVPLIPLRAYVVTPCRPGYRIHAEVSLPSFARRYTWRLLPYLITVLVESAARAALVIGLVLLVLAGLAYLFGWL